MKLITRWRFHCAGNFGWHYATYSVAPNESLTLVQTNWAYIDAHNPGVTVEVLNIYKTIDEVPPSELEFWVEGNSDRAPVNLLDVNWGLISTQVSE